MALLEMSEFAEMTAWEKCAQGGANDQRPRRASYIFGLALLAAGLAYLLVSSNLSGGQFFITVEDLQADTAYIGQPAQIVGAVLGPSIEYDVENLRLRFTVAHMPTRSEDLSRALFEAANDPERGAVDDPAGWGSDARAVARSRAGDREWLSGREWRLSCHAAAIQMSHSIRRPAGA